MAFVSHSWHFNPLPRKEGDVKVMSNSSVPADFNPLPRKEGDGCWIWYTVYSNADFNPLPRKEGDSKFR